MQEHGGGGVAQYSVRNMACSDFTKVMGKHSLKNHARTGP